MTYTYRLKNIDKLDEKSLSKYKAKIGRLEPVEAFSIVGDSIEVTLKPDAYEYDLLQMLIAVSDEFDVTVIFGEDLDGDNGLIGGDLPQDDDNNDDFSDDNNEECDPLKASEAEVTGGAENSPRQGARRALNDDDYIDRLDAKKKELKRDSRFRIIELSVSLVLYIVSLFFESGDSVISFKMVLIILSFAISGYDVVYNAGLDIIKKRPLSGNIAVLLSSVVMIVLSQPNVATIVMFLFAAAKFVESLSGRLSDIRREEHFYTGSTPVRLQSSDGEQIARDSIAEGDVIYLTSGEVVPTDGVLLCSARLSSYGFDYSLKTDYTKGEKISAGSIVLSDEVIYVSSVTYGSSLIDSKSEEFDSAIQDDPVTKKLSKIGLYADLCIIGACLLIAFILPVFSATYTDGLEKWGLIAACILSVDMISYSLRATALQFKNLYVVGLGAGVRYKDVTAVKTLATANSVKVSAYALCDEGPNGTLTLKEDALGALNELSALGIKKVSTDFDCDLSSDVKSKIDFVEADIKNERQIYFAAKDAFVAFSGGEVNVDSGEIAYVPFAYKMSKRAFNSAKFGFVLSVVTKVLITAGLFLIPFARFNVAWLAVVGAASNIGLVALPILSLTGSKA